MLFTDDGTVALFQKIYSLRYGYTATVPADS